MKHILAATMALALAPVAGAPMAGAQEAVRDTSHIYRGSERVLEQSVVVDAPISEVWDALTTSEGFASWAASKARIDFRLGGRIESVYSPDAELGGPGTIVNEIVAYAPEQMLAIRNIAPTTNANFDAATFQSLNTVFFFQSLGSRRTRVTVVEPGYRAGAAYDGVYSFFAANNSWSLRELQGHFSRDQRRARRTPPTVATAQR